MQIWTRSTAFSFKFADFCNLKINHYKCFNLLSSTHIYVLYITRWACWSFLRSKKTINNKINAATITFLHIFWRARGARVCWLLFCFCCPFCSFERCLDSNPESSLLILFPQCFRLIQDGRQPVFSPSSADPPAGDWSGWEGGYGGGGFPHHPCLHCSLPGRALCWGSRSL